MSTTSELSAMLDAGAPGQWECPIDPQPEHWRKLAFLQWRAGVQRGVPMTRAETAFLSFMQMLSTTPEFQDEAERHIGDFRRAMRQRRLVALKAKAAAMREALGDWGVPLAELARHMVVPVADTDSYRARASFERKHGVQLCREAWRELQAVQKLEAELVETENAPLLVVGAADAARRQARIASARANAGEAPSAPKPAKKKTVDRNAPVPV